MPHLSLEIALLPEYRYAHARVSYLRRLVVMLCFTPALRPSTP